MKLENKAMNKVLYGKPWMNFFDSFHLEYNIISYPKNMYFVANVLMEYFKQTQDLYKTYPYAEKFDISTLNEIEWDKVVITFDKHLKLLIAPESLKKLINLMKRLDSVKAKQEIFSGFEIPYLQIESFSFIVFVMIVCLLVKICLYFDLFYRIQFF